MQPSHISALRAVLCANMGQTLTPEVCAAIEMQVRQSGANPVDTAAITPERYGPYIIAAERFSEIVGELHELHVAHWRETEKHRHGLPLNPDYAGMAEHERRGQLIQFTVRHQGALVGNLRVYLGVSAHSGTPFAVFPVRTRQPASEEDTLYISPEHRGGFLAMAMLRYAERVLISLGMREIRADSKVINKAGVLMRRMKYTHFADKFIKILEAPNVL
jgi:GNAT superfamily N-acetyltransferase